MCGELATRLADEHGVAVSHDAVGRALTAAGYPLKKRRSGRPTATATT